MSNTKGDNAAVLSTIKPVTDMLVWFKTILADWPKGSGSKPTGAMLMVPLLLGKRPGVEALHIAMCLRPEGCTVQQFMLAGSCGPANNYRRELVKSGWFSLQVEGKPYAYKMTITAKGAAKLERAQVAASEAAQAEAATKPAKAKRKATGKAKGAVNAPAATEVPATETPISEPGNAVDVDASAEAMKAQHEAAEQPTA